jgi:hypothetical protein
MYQAIGAKFKEAVRVSSKLTEQFLRGNGLKVVPGTKLTQLAASPDAQLAASPDAPDAPYVVGTHGSGFGPSREGYFRLSTFGHRENVIKAVERIKKNLKQV